MAKYKHMQRQRPKIENLQNCKHIKTEKVKFTVVSAQLYDVQYLKILLITSNWVSLLTLLQDS